MTLHAQARSAYSPAAPVRTPRAAEYEIFARVTHRLSAADETDRAAFPTLAAAASDNQ
ncbi:flagellar biosynthesis regulator FlhF, partial [Amaricoccus sp. HAR-UPW-R2A-40]